MILSRISKKPQIAAARREIHFFDRNEHYYDANGEAGGKPDYDWYKSKMAPARKNQVKHFLMKL